MPKTEAIKATLKCDKVCKGSKRYSGDAENGVTTAIYVLNDGVKKLGDPESIEVTIAAAK